MDAIVLCPHCRAQNRVPVQWPQAKAECVICHRTFEVSVPNPCLYCAVTVAQYSGDPYVGFPRCGRCRTIHRFLEYASIGFKGLFVSLLFISIAFFASEGQTWVWSWVLGSFVLVLLLWQTGIWTKWLLPIDWIRQIVWKQRVRYESAVWRRLPFSFDWYLSTVGITFFVATLWWPSAFLSAFIPSAAEPQGHVLSTVELLLVAEGLAGWQKTDLLAGLLGLAGVIAVLDLVVTTGVPYVLRTRPRLWPRLDLLPISIPVSSKNKTGTIREGMSTAEVQEEVGPPALRPEGLLRDELSWIYQKRAGLSRFRHDSISIFFKDNRVVRLTPERSEGDGAAIRRFAGGFLILCLMISGLSLGHYLRLHAMASQVVRNEIYLRPGIGQNEVHELLGEPYASTDARQVAGETSAPLGHILSTWRYVRGFRYVMVPRYLTLEFKDGTLSNWESTGE